MTFDAGLRELGISEQQQAEWYAACKAELERLEASNEPPRFRVVSAEEFMADESITADPAQSMVVEHIYKPSDLIDADTFADEPDETPNDQIPGVIPTTGTGQIFGPSGSFKSFMALKVSTAIVFGDAFHTKRVARQGGIVYVVGEGVRGMKRRLRAIRKHRGVEGFAERFKVLRVPVNLFKPSEAKELVAKIRECMPDVTLCVFDTKWRCSLGAREDSADDNQIIFGNADYIARELNAFCLLVSHTGLDETRARGSTSQKAACDVELQMLRKGDNVALRVVKAKDGESGIELMFKSKVIDLGRNEFEEPESSLVLEPIEAAEAAVMFQPNGKIEKAVFDYVRACGEESVSKQAVIDAAAEASGSRPYTVKRAIENQLVGRLFVADGDELELRPGLIVTKDWLGE